MRSKTFLRLTAILFLFIFCIASASADTTVRPTVAVSYEIEPAVLLPGDSGTVTLSFQNMATGEVYVIEEDETFDMNAYIRSVVLDDNDAIEVIDKGYDNVGLVGPGDMLKLTFNIQAKENASDGVHFMVLELVGGSDMYDLNYKIPVKVDSRDLKLIVSNLPSTTMNEISMITVDVVNNRPNDVSGVIVTPVGEDVSFKPSELFVGPIPAGNKSTATFTLNTMESEPGVKDLSFSASYFNGDNLHQSAESDTTIKVVDRYALIFTSIEIENVGNTYTINGDLNNFGTTDAKNIMVSVIGSDGIEPVQPYANYFIGSLEADDFSSFELSASVTSSNVTSIPVLVEFRDTDNAYTSLVGEIDLEGPASAVPLKSGDGPSSIVLLTAFVGMVGVSGVIGYSWKKRNKRQEEEE